MKGFYMVKEAISDFFNAVIDKTFVITVMISIFVKDFKPGYGYAFLPFILAAICLLSYIPFYIKEDMSLKQIFLLRGIELVILEISVCQAVLCLSGADVTISGYMAIMLFTAFFDVLSYMVRWYLDMEEADFINQKIAEYHAVRNGDYTYESDRKNDTASCTRGRNTGVF